ncbi:MAG: hypothetical protein AAFX89_13525, partial [Pseudomonadota bacterium]
MPFDIAARQRDFAINPASVQGQVAAQLNARRIQTVRQRAFHNRQTIGAQLHHLRTLRKMTIEEINRPVSISKTEVQLTRYPCTVDSDPGGLGSEIFASPQDEVTQQGRPDQNMRGLEIWHCSADLCRFPGLCGIKQDNLGRGKKVVIAQLD